MEDTIQKSWKNGYKSKNSKCSREMKSKPKTLRNQEQELLDDLRVF
jgi:hypothetical protein